MKKILLPTDFSPSARNAFAFAIGLFGTRDVEYTLLHTYAEPKVGADVMISINDILEKQAVESLQREHKTLMSIYQIPPECLKWEVEYGQLHRVLNHVIERNNIDLVVMGTTGASGIKKIVIGSHTSDAIKKVKCPILAIPEQATFKPFKKVALAADYRNMGDGHLLKLLSDVIDKNQALVQVINFKHDNEEATVEETNTKKALENMLEGISHTFHEEISKNVAQGINHFVSTNNIDLLTMIARQHTIFERVFHRSVTGELSMLTTVPLLVLHEQPN